MTNQDASHYPHLQTIVLRFFGRRLMRRHGSSQSGCSNISLLDELADTNVNSLPLALPEVDAESNIEDERLENLPSGGQKHIPFHVVKFQK